MKQNNRNYIGSFDCYCDNFNNISNSKYKCSSRRKWNNSKSKTCKRYACKFNRSRTKCNGGFKIANDSGSTVKDGIVIEDASGNQFVWILVSNIDGDESNKIKVDANAEVEITLGRYTFAASDATANNKYGTFRTLMYVKN